MRYIQKIKFFTRSIICFTIGFSLSTKAQEKTKPNIVFIAIDDLKPELACYGNTLIKTPNIDRLAKMSTVFMNNYCQQAVCSPTRASLMTGMRPDMTKIWDLKTKMRDINPDILTLPQYLISQGYTTSGIGKIYHPSSVDKQSDVLSWSIPLLKVSASDYANGLGEPAFKHYQSQAIKKMAADDALLAREKGKKNKDDDGENATDKRGPATESLDLPDYAYEDGVNALRAKSQIIDLSKAKKPYFMAVGFHKPHLPFVAPKKYWDLYKREDMPLAPFQEHAANEVFIAYESSGELRNYTDIPEFTTFTKEELRAGLKPEKQKELIHGYYASVSYVDAQVGILLNTLDSLGTLNNTIIVLWGDHGWHLGDHDLWGKHTNFQQATRSPLMIAAPGMLPGKTNSITEHLDVFPSICNLAGLAIPEVLQGKSLKPIMQNKKAIVKDFAMSQYPRKLKGADVKTLGYTDGKLMGYSLRNEQYRLTVWMNNNFTSAQPYTPSRVYATELYNYVVDPLEKVNVTDDEKYEIAKKAFMTQMVAFFKSQEKAN
jgi:iduronate 2-sulfatase